ncbi:alpha-1,2-fucosyltransferase [Pedobacter aquatilis]|uniref:alpha-1,2-fucosyltransferase n=1 Tax=Pedobacter aquatilis TaxID=351343 RepID=UPI002931BABE|nr:alpha-1,2-fucosyltransferase [Pedobacter aquatilis]
MILVKLKGGLGNQMFQYATAKMLAKKTKLFFDNNFFDLHNTSNDYFTAREFSLHIFTKIKIIKANQILKYILKKTLLPGSKRIFQSEENEWIDFKKIAFSHAYINGYFQNENYFKEIRNELLIDFNFPEVQEYNLPLEQQITMEENSVAMHVRRGDYLKPHVESFHGVLPIDYYKLAVEKINKRVHAPHYYIFSDDPAWCEQNFKFLKTEYTIVSKPGNYDWEEMKIMGCCKHYIIANSSYSWWAAWLNKNPDKIVIAPRNWLVKKELDIIPAAWLKI